MTHCLGNFLMSFMLAKFLHHRQKSYGWLCSSSRIKWSLPNQLLSHLRIMCFVDSTFSPNHKLHPYSEMACCKDFQMKCFCFALTGRFLNISISSPFVKSWIHPICPFLPLSFLFFSGCVEFTPLLVNKLIYGSQFWILKSAKRLYAS